MARDPGIEAAPCVAEPVETRDGPIRLCGRKTLADAVIFLGMLINAVVIVLILYFFVF